MGLQIHSSGIEKEQADRFDYYMSPFFFWYYRGRRPYLYSLIRRSQILKNSLPGQTKFLFLLRPFWEDP